LMNQTPTFKFNLELLCRGVMNLMTNGVIDIKRNGHTDTRNYDLIYMRLLMKMISVLLGKEKKCKQKNFS
jgi:hypothetical protein